MSIVRAQRNRRRSTGTPAMLGAGVVAALALPATPAVASSEGCTGVSDGYTCFQIHGHRTHVEEFVQSRGKVSTQTPVNCNYYAVFTVEKDGQIIWQDRSEAHDGCFYSPRVSRTLAVNLDFPRGSKACGSWYSDGSRIGTACNRIF
jgi:hypothetical protein